MTVSLISVAELEKGLNQAVSDIAVVDASTSREYLNGHIPGAISLLWENWCAKLPDHPFEYTKWLGYWGLLAGPAGNDFAARLGLSGVRSDKPIVVYADSPSSRGR